jgi:LacI family transcriptional regulator
MEQKKRYTVHDIAKRLNTTASTVSRALQNNPRISLKMRQAVMELALELNYQPDFRALSLRTGSGRTIGVLVPQVDRHFFATVLMGIDKVATSANYDVLICQSLESLEKEKTLAHSLLNGKIDGLIASVSIETHNGDHFKLFQKKEVPLVFFDRILNEMDVSKVIINDYQAAVMSVEHLISNGCKRIAHFAGPQHIHVYSNRTRGYIDTLYKHGMKPEEDIIFQGVITRETGCEAMQKILKMTNPPDAIFSSGDYSALGAMICAREAGLCVPKDIAITGFANEPFGEIVEPALTSVDQHGIEMGRMAATLLIEEIEKNGSPIKPKTVVLDPNLIIRKSSVKTV